MIKKIKYLITTLSVSGMLLIPVALVPAVVNAEATNTGSICTGSNLTLDGSSTCDSSSGTTLDGIIHFVLQIFSAIVGIIAVIMIVVGGLKYILSGGESSKVSGAKDTILFAIVGLVVVALAQVIVHFVLNSVAQNGGGS